MNATNNQYQWIVDDQGPIALIVSACFTTDKSVFFTKPEMEQQLGIIKHPKGAIIQAHDHRAVERTINSCPECLILRRGSCEMTLYDRRRNKLSDHLLNEGDIVLLLAGGHGFRMLDDCELIETRAGAFPGDSGKERF
ncbi:MAG TPA: hypothetical protein PJ991_09215 [Kiritimatiellia bacterium]|nr:hypothetical protein [Kiritimatiellia bacterium]